MPETKRETSVRLCPVSGRPVPMPPPGTRGRRPDYASPAARQYAQRYAQLETLRDQVDWTPAAAREQLSRIMKEWVWFFPKVGKRKG